MNIHEAALVAVVRDAKVFIQALADYSGTGRPESLAPRTPREHENFRRTFETALLALATAIEDGDNALDGCDTSAQAEARRVAFALANSIRAQ